MKAFDLGYGHKGNGITVWCRNRIEHGDYKKIAHISPDREISWRIKRIPADVRAKVESVAKNDNSNISATQDIKIFNS